MSYCFNVCLVILSMCILWYYLICNDSKVVLVCWLQLYIRCWFKIKVICGFWFYSYMLILVNQIDFYIDLCPLVWLLEIEFLWSTIYILIKRMCLFFSCNWSCVFNEVWQYIQETFEIMFIKIWIFLEDRS